MAKNCAICGGRCATLIELPNLPLTGLFTDHPEGIQPLPGYDLTWQFCENCSHGQLDTPLSPQTLYGNQYHFRTGASTTAKSGAKVFRNWITELFPERKYGTIVEFGCNDASLLELFADIAERRIGIDPVLAHLDSHSDGIELIPKLIEEVALTELCDGGPDMVMCQHTLEHIVSPATLIEQLVRQTKPGTLFVFEFPCLDALLAQGRFDQIFHEHVQYFSVRSISILLQRLGLEVVDFRFNFSHWGALLVAFQTGSGGDRGLAQAFSPIGPHRLMNAWQGFQHQISAFRELLSPDTGSPRIGYGAALMLPVINYHFDFVGNGLTEVVDDDPLRQGLWYRNLPIRIVNGAKVDFSRATVLLTAPDNRRAILRRLADLSPYRIISPLLAL